jgi:hypothetical protein
MTANRKKVWDSELPLLAGGSQSTLRLNSLGIMRSCGAAPMFKGPLST